MDFEHNTCRLARSKTRGFNSVQNTIVVRGISTERYSFNLMYDIVIHQ